MCRITIYTQIANHEGAAMGTEADHGSEGHKVILGTSGTAHDSSSPSRTELL